MSKSSLFNNSVSKIKNLVEFKAGKMNIDDKNWVHPDKRKGLAYIHQTPDGLTHFCWKDRNSGVVEDDLIVFPEDTEFKRIPQCTTGRVYVLKFKSSKKLFLWLQEPKDDGDEVICKKVNDNLNMVPSQSGEQGRVSVDSEMQEILTELGAAGYSMSQNEIMSILGIGPSSETLGSDSESSIHGSSTRPSARAAKAEPEVTAVAETTSIVPNTLKIGELRSALSATKPAVTGTPSKLDETNVENALLTPIENEGVLDTDMTVLRDFQSMEEEQCSLGGDGVDAQPGIGSTEDGDLVRKSASPKSPQDGHESMDHD